MVARHKNLLEAFRQSAPEGRAAASLKVAPPANTGGPFAGGAGIGSTGPRLGFGEAPRRPLLRRALGDRTVQLALLGGAIALLVVFALRGDRPAEAGAAGPGSPGETVQAGMFARGVAAEGNRPAGASGAEGTAPDPARANEVSAQLGTPEDQAFHDLANDYTVQVVGYKNDENGLKHARATVAWLRKEGYPAVQPIRTGNGKWILVCVGAKPKRQDLETLVEFVRGLRGPPPQAKEPPFKSAFVVRIDDVLKRR